MRSYFYALVAALSLSIAAQAKPPTVDPTFGQLQPSVTKTFVLVPAEPGYWIWTSSTKDNQTVLFRRKFSLTSAPKSAVMHITCDNFFTIFVNSRQVDQTKIGDQDDNDWKNVHSLNIASYLKAGENIIAVRAYNTNDAAGLLARLEISGGPAFITDRTWKAHEVSSPPKHWEMLSFDDSAWEFATSEVKEGQGIWGAVSELHNWDDDFTEPYLAHIALPVARIPETHDVEGNILGLANLPGRKETVITVTPPVLSTTDDPNFVIDFGEEIAGRVQLTGLTNGTISAGTGESFEEASQKGPSLIHLLPGQVSYTPYSAFRYVKLIFPKSKFSGPIRFQIEADHKYYPVQYKGGFSCSDPLITKIWFTGAYTAHLCMQEYVYDSPKRNRSPLAGDLNATGLVIDDVFADRFLMEQTLQQLIDGTNNSHVNSIPGYSCAWICALADFHRHIGDYDFLKKQHDSLIALLEHMKGDIDDNGLFADKSNDLCFVDWSPGLSEKSPESLASTHFFYIKAAREASFLLQEMGDDNSARKYADWANALADVARKRLITPDLSTFGDRLQENAMAVYSETPNAAERDAIYKRILAPDSPAWDKTGNPPYNNKVITPYYCNYALCALSLTGHTDDALRILRSYWGGMLNEGATTFWELYDPLWDKNNYHANLTNGMWQGFNLTLCHGWSAGPTSWLTDHVLGVRPTSGGFKTAVIQPELGDLEWVEGDVPTPNGIIHVRATKRLGHTACYVVLPKGIEAVVLTPGQSPVHLSHSGEYTIK